MTQRCRILCIIEDKIAGGDIVAWRLDNKRPMRKKKKRSLLDECL